MRTHTINETLELKTEVCCACHIVFAVPAEFRKARLDDHHTFYCPNGHGQSYTGLTEAQRLAKEKAELEKRLASELEWQQTQSAWLREEREAHKTTTRRLAATKGVLTKTRKRIGNGVCPCCNRHFTNVGRHMATKHPGFAAPDSEPES